MTIKPTSTDVVRGKILHVLSIYPKISPSMLQISLNIKAAVWRPVMEALIEEGLIKRSTIVSPTPAGRHQSYVVLKYVGETE